jgi:hypothetical protein
MQWTNVYPSLHPWWLIGRLEVDDNNVLFLDDFNIPFK